MDKIIRNLIAGISLLLIVLFLVMSVTLTAPQSAHAAPGILYAAPTAQGSGNCSSWANACTLQTALTNAVSGDEIWVKAGVHYPGAAGNRTATFTLKNGVAIYGGFAGTETSRDQRNWQTTLTILSGDIDHNDTNTDGNYIAETAADIQGSNTYHVVTGGGTDSSAVLDGFVITAGQASGSSPNNAGGGMYNDNSSPTLNNVTFSGNYAAKYGGGMQNELSNPTLTNVTFTGNYAQYGGGMSVGVGSPSLTHVIFSNNSAQYGGGLNSSSSSPRLTNVIFSGNSATDTGGGMYNWYSNSTLINVSFSGNSANKGGGIYNDDYNYSWRNPTLANVILWGNRASVGPELYNYRGTPTISYSDIRGCGGSGSGWNPACGRDDGGNIDANPFFVDAPSGNLRLQGGSPAIDAGNNAAVPAGVTTDLDGNPRFDYTVDMGAYEYQAGPGPRPFGKTAPSNTDAFQPLTLTLSWNASVLASTYAYCSSLD